MDYRKTHDGLSFLPKIDKILTHRGPDGNGVYLYSFKEGKNKVVRGQAITHVNFPANYFVLHRRLAIIDLVSGFQPMSNEDGTIWIVCNGEIYNFNELRRSLKLKNHQFKTLCDTEVIIHLYEEYGPRCVNYLRGMFAFAIWDEKNKRVFIARDRLGIKPLYYYSKDSLFIFASELKALLPLQEIDFEISEGAIDDYVTYGYIPHPKTVFKNIRKLPPGTFLVLEEYGEKIAQYWKPKFNHYPHKSISEYTSELEKILSESVSLRLISDVPLGAFLSGGLDSSTIVALMSRNSNERVRTFSIGFKEREYDETPYAKIVAKKYGTDHHSFVVEPQALDVIFKIVSQLDEPFADSSVLPTYFLSKMASEHVKVCLSGDGGDEIFGGYKSYSRSLIYKYWDLIPVSLRKKLIGPLYNKWPTKKTGKGLLERILAERDERFWLMLGLTTEIEKKILYNESFYQQIQQMEGSDSPMTLPRFSSKKDYLCQMQQFDMQFYLPADILEKVDKMSMLNSLEVRVPILDHYVAEFMCKVTSSMKAKNFNTKILFKEMAKNLLPKKIITRKKKGFSVPLKYWFKGHLDEFAKSILLDSQCINRGYFKKKAIEDLFFNHQTGSRDFSQKIWRLLMLELWFREYHYKALSL